MTQRLDPFPAATKNRNPRQVSESIPREKAASGRPGSWTRNRALRGFFLDCEADRLAPDSQMP
jgi:hypothetical protein